MDPDSLELDLDSSDADDPGPSTKHPRGIKVPKLTLKRPHCEEEDWRIVSPDTDDEEAEEIKVGLCPLVQSDDESDDEGEETGDDGAEETGDDVAGETGDDGWEDLAQPTIGDILGEQYEG